jgi:hypothetical protein
VTFAFAAFAVVELLGDGAVARCDLGGEVEDPQESAVVAAWPVQVAADAPAVAGYWGQKRAFFLAAFASLNDPASRAYYDKKIAQGKRHTQALLCLARRRIDVLFAMLCDGTFYESRPAAA